MFSNDGFRWETKQFMDFILNVENMSARIYKFDKIKYTRID